MAIKKRITIKRRQKCGFIFLKNTSIRGFFVFYRDCNNFNCHTKGLACGMVFKGFTGFVGKRFENIVLGKFDLKTVAGRRWR